MSKALTRTWNTILKTIESFKKLILGDVSVKSIGGPLAIGKVASDSFNTSLSYFFQLMALISVNLGVINLFPIPVLDGGHIMFILLEVINRGPVSRRKMEIAQQVGLSMLLMLMVGAIFNDVTRFF
jgi:regulator of sigma E protease